VVEEITSLDDERFMKPFTSFTDSAWRLETLDYYDVGYEQEAYAAFLAGDLSLIHDSPSPWIDQVITPAVDEGRYIGRVHVIERVTDADGKLALSDYLRFEFEWYKRNKAAGDDIRIAWAEPGKWPRNVWKQGCDFWLFDAHTDHAKLMEMHYTETGEFRVAVLSDNREHVKRAHRCAKAAQVASKPFYP
jgi:hypothetical protein